MRSGNIMKCSVVVLAVVLTPVAVTTSGTPWLNQKWREERRPFIDAVALTFQPEILPRLGSESCSCIEARLCPEFLEMLAYRSTHSEVLRQLTCGFKGFLPLVCCNQVLVRRYFPTAETYPHPQVPRGYDSNCGPHFQSVTTVEPRINPSTTPYHTPGVYYHSAPTLRSGTTSRIDFATENTRDNRFYPEPRFRPHENVFTTPSTVIYNVANSPKLPAMTPNYYDITAPGYSRGMDQNDPPEFYPHHPTAKPNYPHRSLEPGYWNNVNHPPYLHVHNPGDYFNNGPREHFHHVTMQYPYNTASPTYPHVTPEDRGDDVLGYPHHHDDSRPPSSEARNSTDALPDKPTSESSTNSAEETGNGSDGRQWKRTLLPSKECGVSLGERIVGGKNALLGAYPWVARIGYTRSGSDAFLYRCGGSLINNRYVITAAHCVTNLPGGLRLATVRLGELDERTDPDCYRSECADPVQDFVPREVKVHKDYDKPRFRNDVALIRLDRPVNISTYISPICLPFDSLSNKTYTGLRSLVAGWGATDLGRTSSSPVLQWVRVTVVPSVGCAKAFAERTGTQLGPGQICAGGEKGRDSCEGDSGGPLMRGEQLGPEDFQRYYLVGVVSFGARRCGSENLPGVYTETTAYLNWILDSIEP